MISDFCYATLNSMGLGGNIAVSYGQAIIMIGGIATGLFFASRYRRRTRDQRYLRDEN